ncbi:MAG: OsmC family protein, partial [Candidatus Omnitrophica bacterium]|nr:OsmC family protein [Candidatus Omnitrophota bacterium]
MAIKVEITATDKDKFLADFISSGTKIYVDLNKENPSGPNPLEVFLASVASCVCVFARKYLIQHSVEFKELKVSATAEASKDSPSRLVDIKINAHTDANLNAQDKEV